MRSLFEPIDRKALSDWLIVALIAGLGAALLSIRLDWQEYWWDEHVSLGFTRLSWYELMIEHWGTDTHRPVYYGLQKLWNSIFGESIVAVRSLSLVLTIMMVPLFYAIARRIGPDPLALMTVILLISAPVFVYQGREVRMYALAHLALALALWCAVELAARARADMQGQEPQRGIADRWIWATFATALAGAFYAQAMGVFTTALLGFWILACVGLRLLPIRFLWQALAALALYILLILPALPPFFLHVTGTIGDTFWVPDLSFAWVYQETTTVYPYPKWSKPVVALMILWGLWSLRDRPHFALLMGFMVIGLPLLVLAVSFYKQIYISRVIAWGSVVSILVLAVGLVRLRPILRWAGVAVLVILQLMAYETFLPAAPERSAERTLSEGLKDFDPDRDVLLLGYHTIEPALRWHAPRAFEGKAYAFNYADYRTNVIDAAMHATFVMRADADQIVLPKIGRLFVVHEAEVPASRGAGPEDLVAPALDIVIGDRPLLRSTRAERLQLDVYALD